MKRPTTIAACFLLAMATLATAGCAVNTGDTASDGLQQNTPLHADAVAACGDPPWTVSAGTWETRARATDRYLLCLQQANALALPTIGANLEAHIRDTSLASDSHRRAAQALWRSTENETADETDQIRLRAVGAASNECHRLEGARPKADHAAFATQTLACLAEHQFALSLRIDSLVDFDQQPPAAVLDYDATDLPCHFQYNGWIAIAVRSYDLVVSKSEERALIALASCVDFEHAITDGMLKDRAMAAPDVIAKEVASAVTDSHRTAATGCSLLFEASEERGQAEQNEADRASCLWFAVTRIEAVRKTFRSAAR